jgi:hypothetical protein
MLLGELELLDLTVGAPHDAWAVAWVRDAYPPARRRNAVATALRRALDGPPDRRPALASRERAIALVSPLPTDVTTGHAHRAVP